MGDRSLPFMLKLLAAPLNLPQTEAEVAPSLRDFGLILPMVTPV